MQDKYVGDIGDYIKYALLRAVMEAAKGKKLGVAWYLCPDENNNDGKHTGYLHAPEVWERLDEDLFEKLRKIVCIDGERSVAAIKDSKILGKNVKFFCKPVPHKKMRQDWFACLQKQLKGCDVIFCDPNTGLQVYKRCNQKHIALCEAVALSGRNRTSIFYHHLGQHKKHCLQISEWTNQLRKKTGQNVMTLKWNKIVPRAFFIVNPSKKIKKALGDLEQRALCIGGGKGKPAIEIIESKNR